MLDASDHQSLCRLQNSEGDHSCVQRHLIRILDLLDVAGACKTNLGSGTIDCSCEMDSSSGMQPRWQSSLRSMVEIMAAMVPSSGIDRSTEQSCHDIFYVARCISSLDVEDSLGSVAGVREDRKSLSARWLQILFEIQGDE